ncbi:hypothetical protein FB45DRAFT_61203 [Roridomyces roridus]|uniref:Uncharacterized protein n=1 Tax=Roridomyces roridus TaxID=1738132 RepID=A0AAD7FJD4_9AGAR|nr:hypothetical protein FB45DRAFT_61203 [Roridomyces roridus]
MDDTTRSPVLATDTLCAPSCKINDMHSFLRSNSRMDSTKRQFSIHTSSPGLQAALRYRLRGLSTCRDAKATATPFFFSDSYGRLGASTTTIWKFPHRDGKVSPTPSVVLLDASTHSSACDWYAATIRKSPHADQGCMRYSNTHPRSASAQTSWSVSAGCRKHRCVRLIHSPPYSVRRDIN